MSKASIALVIILLAAAVIQPAPVPAQELSDVAVRVNGEPITLEIVARGALSRYGHEVLDSLIAALAIEQAAEQAGAEVTPEELRERYEDAERQVELRAPITGINFAAWLELNQMTPQFFRQHIYMTLLLDKMVEAQVNITDAMVADYYQRNRERLRRPEQMRVAHICVTDRDKAEQIRSQIVDGDISFEDAAKAHSVDPWTKEIGGDFGYIVAGDDPFQQAAFELTRDGQMSDIVETKMGYHIIKRLERREAHVPAFEDIQQQLKRSMERERMTRLVTEKRTEILQAADIQRESPMPPYPLSDNLKALEDVIRAQQQN